MAMGTRYPQTRRVPALNGEGLGKKLPMGMLSGVNPYPTGEAGAGMGVPNPHPNPAGAIRSSIQLSHPCATQFLNDISIISTLLSLVCVYMYVCVVYVCMCVFNFQKFQKLQKFQKI